MGYIFAFALWWWISRPLSRRLPTLYPLTYRKSWVTPLRPAPSSPRSSPAYFNSSDSYIRYFWRLGAQIAWPLLVLSAGADSRGRVLQYHKSMQFLAFLLAFTSSRNSLIVPRQCINLRDAETGSCSRSTSDQLSRQIWSRSWRRLGTDLHFRHVASGMETALHWIFRHLWPSIMNNMIHSCPCSITLDYANASSQHFAKQFRTSIVRTARLNLAPCTATNSNQIEPEPPKGDPSQHSWFASSL